VDDSCFLCNSSTLGRTGGTKLIGLFSKISGLYCDIYETNDWIASTHHAGSAGGTTLVANSNNRLRLVSDSDARLRSIIANIEENRVALAESASPEAAQLLTMAILQLRMRLHRIADSEFKALCHAMQRQEALRSKKSDDLTSKDRRFTGRGPRWPSSIK
jgi:hypothetical protein